MKRSGKFYTNNITPLDLHKKRTRTLNTNNNKQWNVRIDDLHSNPRLSIVASHSPNRTLLHSLVGFKVDNPLLITMLFTELATDKM